MTRDSEQITPCNCRFRIDNSECVNRCLHHAELENKYDELTAQLAAARAENERLRFALQGLHDDNADYLRINNLGGYDNHWMVIARAALAKEPPR